MPRILKRPMFSRGGTTKKNNGIMTGLVDRTEKNQGGRIGYAEGKTQAEIYADEYYDQLSKIQPPKPKFNLGEFGMNLASGKYAGDGFVSSLIGSGREPYSKFTAADDKRRELDYNTKMAAAKMGISKADAEKLAITTAKAKAGKDKFRTLSDEEAKLRFKGTYVPNVLYQENITTGEVKTKRLGPTEIIKENVDEYKKEIDKSQGQKDVETISSAEKSFSEANKFSQTINVLNLLANSSDEELKTGTLGPLRLSATKLLNELGIDVDFQNVPLAELLNAVGGKVAVDALQGFKGAISNKELDFVVNRNPGLSTSKDGIKLQLELLSRANEISKKYYKEIISPFVTKNGGLRGTLDGKTFAQLQIEFYENNPYLTDDIRDKISSVENVIDPEYKKNIVVKDGISYFVDPETGNVRQLPVIEE